jgi:deferrochelatase/peroxidase EfeB
MSISAPSFSSSASLRFGHQIAPALNPIEIPASVIPEKQHAAPATIIEFTPSKKEVAKAEEPSKPNKVVKFITKESENFTTAGLKKTAEELGVAFALVAIGYTTFGKKFFQHKATLKGLEKGAETVAAKKEELHLLPTSMAIGAAMKVSEKVVNGGSSLIEKGFKKLYPNF